MRKIFLLLLFSLSFLFASLCDDIKAEYAGKMSNLRKELDFKCYEGEEEYCQCFLDLRKKLEDKCDLDDKIACKDAGWMYTNQKNTKFNDQKKSAELFAKACDLDYIAYCYMGGGDYVDLYNETKDRKYILKAKLMLKKACDNDIKPMERACKEYKKIRGE